MVPTALETKVSGLLQLALGRKPAIHQVKQYTSGQYLVIPQASETYCHIRGGDHSCAKSYYILDVAEGTVKQKCHSAACADFPKTLYPTLPNFSESDLAPSPI